MRLSWIVVLLLSQEFSVDANPQERSLGRGAKMKIRSSTSHREFKKEVEKLRRIPQRLSSRELLGLPDFYRVSREPLYVRPYPIMVPSICFNNRLINDLPCAKGAQHLHISQKAEALENLI
jgi:hypothetical protein